MSTLTIPHSFALNETPLTSTNLNSNFSAIASVINGNLDTTNITAGVITNTQISSSAAIALSKLASGTSAQIIVGNVSGVPTYVTASGDVTNDNAGVFSIGAGKVTNTMLAGSIAYSKLSLTGAVLNADLAGSITAGKLTLTSANIIVGNGSNVGAGVAMSGDVTIDNTGATTIGSNKVTTAKINAAAVTSDKLAATAGIAGMTSANQGITTSSTDITGMVTSTLSPGQNGNVDVDFSVRLDNTGGSLTSITLGILESVNGGAYASVGGTNAPAMTLVAGYFGVLSGRIRRSVTAGSTYAYKCQVGGTANSGNATQGSGSFIHWQIVS